MVTLSLILALALGQGAPALLGQEAGKSGNVAATSQERGARCPWHRL
jgi:hypothetical protein